MPRSRKKVAYSDDESDYESESDIESDVEDAEEEDEEMKDDEETSEVESEPDDMEEQTEDVEEEEDDDNYDDDEESGGKRRKRVNGSKFNPARESDIIIEDDDVNPIVLDGETIIPDEDRMSDPMMFWYEVVAIVGTRAQQLANGAPPRVKVNAKNVLTIALAELRQKTIPYKIKRYLPGNKVEIWKLDELEFIYDIPDEI